MAVRQSNVVMTFVCPRVLKWQAEEITNQTGATLGAIVRLALQEYVKNQKIRMAAMEKIANINE